MLDCNAATGADSNDVTLLPTSNPHSSVQPDNQVGTCPICGVAFPMRELLHHADLCCRKDNSLIVHVSFYSRHTYILQVVFPACRPENFYIILAANDYHSVNFNGQ